MTAPPAKGAGCLHPGKPSKELGRGQWEPLPDGTTGSSVLIIRVWVVEPFDIEHFIVELDEVTNHNGFQGVAPIFLQLIVLGVAQVVFRSLHRSAAIHQGH